MVWLQRRQAEVGRMASLSDLAAAELASPLQLRKFDNLVERIGHQVTEQLTPTLEKRFHALPDNEINAAVLAVVDVLDQADLSDAALLAADANAEQLARRLRAQFPTAASHALLSEQASSLYDLALDQACRYLVQVIRHLPAFQSAALAEVLARLSAQAEQLDILLASTPTTTLHAPRGTDHDVTFRDEYVRCLTASLDRLELLGLPGDEQPTLALTVAYLSLSVSEMDGRVRGARRLGRPLGDGWFGQLDRPGEAEGVPVESAIGESSRTLLLGDAGSGKTTLLHWLAVKGARGELSGALTSWNGCVPFTVRLRSFVTADLPSPEQFVRHCADTVAELMPPGWVHRQLRAGSAMLLVDGVDEVPAERRHAVKSWLRNLLASFPSVRVVVTARKAAAHQRWLVDEQFSTVTLEPMSPGNILAFVERWHAAAEAAGAVNVSEAQRRLHGQLEQPHLHELAATPLLCAMLCALNLAYRSELPRNRMDLYAKALAMLLHLRDAERGIAGLLSDMEKRVLLRDLAWRLTLANRIELSTGDTLEHLAHKLPGMPNVSADPEALLTHLLERSGVLREPVPGRVDFVHRTFQEYLAADEAIQQHHVGTLIGQAHLDTWRETIVMACGHATSKQASQLLTGILDRAEERPSTARRFRLLAAACLETVQDIDPAVRQRVDRVIEQQLIPPRSIRETGTLASIGHRVLRYLPTELGELSEAKAAAVVRAAALTATADALPLLASYAQDSRSDVQEEIERAWQYFDPARFADEVLAESPLRNGSFTILSRRFLPYASRLRALTSLSVKLALHDQLDDLQVIEGLPALTEFTSPVAVGQSVDLAPLSRHVRLEKVWIYNAQRFKGTRTLRLLPNLRNLNMSAIPAFRTLDFLRDLPQLNALYLGRVEGKGGLRAIESLIGLSRLTLSHCRSQQIAQLNPIETVTDLSLHFDDIVDSISSVKDVFPRTEHINIGGMASIDLRPLVGLAIKSIVLQNINDLDLSPLGEIDTLNQLYLFNITDEFDLSPLADMNIRVYSQYGSRLKKASNLGPGVKIIKWR